MRTSRTTTGLSALAAISLAISCGPAELGEYENGGQRDPFYYKTMPKKTLVNVVAMGSGWRQLSVSGTMQNLDTGTTTTVSNEHVFVLSGTQGIYGAPLPASVRSDLNADVSQLLSSGQITSADQAVYFVHKATAEAADAGILTKLYASKGIKLQITKGCGDYTKTYEKQLPILNKTMSFNDSFSNSGFTGQLRLDGKAHGVVYGELKLRIKRKWCIPYWARLIHVRVSGSLQAEGKVKADGKFHKEWSWDTQVTKIGLGDLDFTIGIIPVHLAFSLPVDFGIEAMAQLDANLDGTVKANGTFDYLCTTSGCEEKSKSFNHGFTPNGSPTISFSGRTTLKPWLQAAVRAALYDEGFAYGQVGVRAYLLADLWGHVGNNCGDADNDGVNELVELLTLDADVGIDVMTKLELLGSKIEPDPWSIGKWHVAFWDLSREGDLAPIFYRKKNESDELEIYDPSLPNGVPFQGRMRPCWPYNDKVDYSIDWNDGTVLDFPVSYHPYTLFTAYKEWTGAKPYAVTLTAEKDAHGRQLDLTRSARAGGFAFPLFEMPEQKLLP